MKIEVENIEIKKGLGKNIKIGILQLKSPFFDEIDKVQSEQGHVFRVTEDTKEKYEKLIEKIKKIFKKLEDMDINILVFPEYAFLKDDKTIIGDDKSTIQICQDFSNKSKTIVVGNYYDETNRASVSFVALPEGYAPSAKYTALKQYTGIKQTLSTYDDDVLKPIDKIKKEDEKVLKFWWKPDGEETKAYFQILTCKDYLYFTGVGPLREWPDIVSVENPGLIISPMSTPEIKTFESRAMALMRDVNIETGEKSIVSILCNATSVPEQETNNICGQSQIISPIDIRTETKPLIKRGVEGIIIATINPFKSIIKPTPTSERESNAVMLSSETYEIIESENNTIDLIEIGPKRKHIGVVVHPEALSFLGLKRIYGFMRVDKYPEIKKKVGEKFKGELKDISIALYGVYGIHDILVLSYEELYEEHEEILKTRLWPIIKDDKYFDRNHFGYCIVEKTIKHRGIPLDEYKPNLAEYRRESNVEETRMQLRDIVLGKEVSGKLINKLKKDKIVVETPFDISDISDRERNEGKLEFLVTIKLIPPGKRLQSKSIHDDFEKHVLPGLKSDERVRTIEKVRTGGGGFVDMDYTLHVVGDLSDLNDVVLEKIQNRCHKSSINENIRCGTRVIIPAEHLSDNSYPSLLETEKRRTIEPLIMGISNHWKDLEKDERMASVKIVPSIINLLDESTRSRVFNIYNLADKLNPPDNTQWMPNMYSLTYGATCTIAQPKIGGGLIDTTNLLNCSRGFVSDIAREIETELIKIFENIEQEHSIPKEYIEVIVNTATKTVKREEGKFRIGSIEIGSVAYLLESLNGIYTKDKYKRNIKNEFMKVFKSDEEKVEQHMKYLSKICDMVFKFYLFELDPDDEQYLEPGEVHKQLREKFKENRIDLSSSARIFETDEKIWKISGDLDRYIVIGEKNKPPKVYFEHITMEMVNGMKIFSISARNLMAHTAYGKKELINPELILNSTYHGLKFLEKIGFRPEKV